MLTPTFPPEKIYMSHNLLVLLIKDYAKKPSSFLRVLMSFSGDFILAFSVTWIFFHAPQKAR